MKVNGHESEKAVFVVGSLFAGFIAGATLFCNVAYVQVEQLQHFDGKVYRVVVTQTHHYWLLYFLLAVLLGLFVAWVYAYIAATAMDIFQAIRNWAYRGQAEKMNLSSVLLFGAVWPLAVILGGILFTFIGTIHRTFDFDDNHPNSPCDADGSQDKKSSVKPGLPRPRLSIED